jgi:hypothetical protein
MTNTALACFDGFENTTRSNCALDSIDSLNPACAANCLALVIRSGTAGIVEQALMKRLATIGAQMNALRINQAY